MVRNKDARAHAQLLSNQDSHHVSCLKFPVVENRTFNPVPTTALDIRLYHIGRKYFYDD